MTSKKLIALAAVVAGGMPLAANAGGFYVGAGIGMASYESAEFVDCFGGCGDNFSDDDFAYGLFAGYQVTDAVGVEIGYWDWGSGKDDFDGDQAEVEPSMITVMAVGTAPIAENWALFGKAGVAMLDVDATVTYDGGEGCCSQSGSSDSTDLALGGGVQWNIGNFGIRGEALWVDAEDADEAMMWGVSGLWRFGG